MEVVHGKAALFDAFEVLSRWTADSASNLTVIGKLRQVATYIR